MKMMNDTWLLFMRHLKKTLRTPMWLFLGMLQPALYLLLYMPLLKNLGSTAALPLSEITQIFVPGMLVIMGIANLFAGFRFIPEIKEGFVTRLLVTPISRVSLLVSLVSERSLVLLIQTTVLLIIAYLLGLRVSLLGIILTLVLIIFIGAAMAAVSYIISITTKDEDGLASIVNTIYLPVMLLSGIMLPISLAPEWLKKAAHVNPFYYAVEAARAMFLGNFNEPVVIQGFVTMGLFALFAIWLALRSLRRMTA